MKISTILAIAAASVFALASCSCGSTKQIQDKPVAGHVIFIGLDGMSSTAYRVADMPFTKSLAENGAYTTKKRSVLPSSSAVNWASMFMGAGPELHGYTTWGSKTPELPSRETPKNGIFPTIAQLVRDNYPDAEIGCMYDWNGIKYVVDTLSMNYYAQAPDFVSVPGGLADMAAEYIKAKKPAFTTIVFDNPDHVGHGIGWSTDEYMATLTELDGYVKTIVDAVKEAGIYDDSIIIVTADHGGIDKGHGGKTMDEMETPFIICGKGIKKGVCFDDYSMMQFDIAATLAKIFNVEQPHVWIGRPVEPVFE